MEIFTKITKLLHNEPKHWNTLQKGDKLYLMIPKIEGNNISYTYQESKVITIKEHSSISIIRFKYTYNNKRKRVNLGINKLKYELPYLAVTKATQYARDYTPIYGDIIITFENSEQLNDIYTSLVTDEINKQEQIIEEHKKILNDLRNKQYEKLV